MINIKPAWYYFYYWYSTNMYYTYLYNLSKLNSEYQRHLKKRLIIVFSIHNPYTLEKVHYYKIMTCKYYYLLRYMNKRISKMKKESPRRWTRTTLSLDSYRFEACTPDLRSSSRQWVGIVKSELIKIGQLLCDIERVCSRL